MRLAVPLGARVGRVNKTILTRFLTVFPRIVLNLAWYDFG